MANLLHIRLHILKSKLFLLSSLCIVLVTITIASWLILFPKPAVQELPPPTLSENFDNDLPPAGFIPEIVPDITLENNQAASTNNDNELEKQPDPQIDQAQLKEKEEIEKFMRRRDASIRNSAGGFVVTYPQENGTDYRIENIDQYRNMDKDFSAQQIPATTTTKPVDLSRTLPMTETIPVILIDEVKSELAGEVVRAIIPQNVYSYHGSNILIPAGSTAIGRYKPLQKIGDTRLALAFYRVVTPEGINIKLTGFAADQEGAEGLTGELDNKTAEKFGGAGVAALLQAMAQLTINVENQQQQAAAGAITQPLNEVITQVISQSINIAPTLRIAKGANFNIKFASDIWFPPAVARVIETVAL